MYDFERASSDCRRRPDRLSKPGAVDDSVANRRAELRTASTSEIRSTRPSPLPRDRVADRHHRFDEIRCAVGGVKLILLLRTHNIRVAP